MANIDPSTDLFALVAEEYRNYAGPDATFDAFRDRVGLGGGPFLDGRIDTYSRRGHVTVTGDECGVIARYPLREIHRYLTTPRLPLA